MPRTIRECLRHGVFAAEEGLLLGRPQDILIDPEEHRVAVVILAMRGPFQVATVVPSEEVRSFAEDMIPIPGLASVFLTYQTPHVQEIVDKGLQFRGRDVITSAGHNMGRIVDVQIDDAGKVLEYRVAKGFLRRVFKLTKAVPPSQLQTSGGQVAVVSAEDNESTAENPGPTD